MTAKEELETKYFNNPFFEEELNTQRSKIDFVAELMEDYHQAKLKLLGITNVVGQSEQLCIECKIATTPMPDMMCEPCYKATK